MQQQYLPQPRHLWLLCQVPKTPKTYRLSTALLPSRTVPPRLLQRHLLLPQLQFMIVRRVVNMLGLEINQFWIPWLQTPLNRSTMLCSQGFCQCNQSSLNLR